MPKFSVIIPAYNRASYIAATLRSVFAQTFSDYEVIVVDDASTDDTVEIVRTFGERVKVLEQKNSGPGAARNLGSKHARGEYLAFLDSDDLWFPWTLAAYDELLRQEQVSIIAGCPYFFEDEAEVARVGSGALKFKRYPDYLSADPAEALPGGGLLVVRSTAFAEVGGFTHERVFSEDAELYMRLGTAPGYALVTAPCTVAYRRHAGSAMHDTPRIAAGLQMILQHEREGKFPGGEARRAARWHFIAHSCRNTAANAARGGHPGLAMSLYGESLGANIREGRWKFVLGLPLVAAGAALGLIKPAAMHGADVVRK